MKRPEDNLQRDIVRYVRTVAPDCLLFSVPNAAKRSMSETWMLYHTGFVTGMFDLCLLAPTGRAHLIEVKTKGNKLSEAQEGIRVKLISMGVPHCIAYSVDDVRAALAQWRVPTIESRSAA